MLNRKKKIKELEFEVEELNMHLDNLLEEDKDKELLINNLNLKIEKMNQEIQNQKTIIEEQKLVINKLKNDKEKEIRKENANKRKWLNGYHGETYGGENK